MSEVTKCGEGCRMYEHDGAFGYCHHPEAPSEMQVSAVTPDGAVTEVRTSTGWQEPEGLSNHGMAFPAPDDCPLRKCVVITVFSDDTFAQEWAKGEWSHEDYFEDTP